MAETAAQSDGPPRRALMLAGGGVKVAFQAGVLQVLLDETDLEFHHFDGASGGSLNLAMLCQGQSGREIADRWRRSRPRQWVQPSLGLLVGQSIARTGRLVANAFTAWGLDFELIRKSDLNATFNVYDFSRHELLVLEPRDMTTELLVACVDLPMWFPPVRKGGDVLIDPVFITDCNVDEAIRRGADELWVIWTVSRRGRWRRGFVHQYFQIIETAANGRFTQDLQRIDASNRALAEGDADHAAFDRTIEYRVLYGEVPLHYLINLWPGPFTRAVDQGVTAARAWCRHEGIPLQDRPPSPPTRRVGIFFTEVLSGSVRFGQRDPRQPGVDPVGARARLKFRVTIHIDDVETFLADPNHEANATGFVQCAALGGRRVISHGVFNLLTESPTDSRLRNFHYRLFFTDGEGRELTLAGIKDVRDHPGADAWADTTTLYTRILQGHVATDVDGATVIAAGIVRLSPLGFVRELLSFRSSGGGLVRGAFAILRFGRAFFSTLYGVYGRRMLEGG